MNGTVRLEFDGEIALIVANNPPVNTITAALRTDLARVLDELERSDARAAVVQCEGSTFFSGADIGEFDGPPREEEYHRLFGRLESLPIPVVAAMHGTVLGGGLELALACHYRVAAPGTRLGFPEVTLGIIPGAGGTQRLPRLVGVEAALELVTGGRPVDAGRALELGLIDRIADGDPAAAALAYARELLAQGGGPRRTGEMTAAPADAGVYDQARARAAKQLRGRQAPLTAIQAIEAATRLSLDDGLRYETELVNQAKQSTESKALIHLFFAERATRRVPDLPDGTQPRPVNKVAIIGAGTMGSGIAICFANAGIPVTLIDVDQASLKRGLERIEKDYASRVARGRMSEDAKAAALRLIDSALGLEAAAEADLVIEAVFEDMALKQRIFTDLDRIAKPGAILATNTSTLDIDAIAAVTKRPQDVIGLHFFSPANVMPLLEVVRTGTTAPDVIRTAMDLTRPIRKTPVLARVCYGFIGNRMMEGYAREAELMVLEGATPRQVDSALENFGMAMGILAVFDLAGIDVGVNVHKANADRYPPDPTYYQADFALAEAGRLGQKTGAGYYRYQPGDRARYDDPEAIAILRERARQLGVPQRSDHSDEEIVERCLLPLINEAFLILEEGVAQRASDIDVVWTSGYGFPRHRGGPLFYAETIGLRTVYDGILKYRERFGPMHWQPAPLLERLATEGRSLADWERSRG